MEAWMGVHRVVILSQFPLVGRAIEQLLQTIDDIEVVACMPDEPEGWSRAVELHPDVVIQVCSTETAPTVPSLPLPEAVGRLIRLEATGNEMYLYQAQQKTATCIDDLIQAIRASGEGACREGVNA